MNEATGTEKQDSGATQEDLTSALFAQLVMQQANMAMMLLGKVSHPESGQQVKDLDAARLFIDELEMLEAKTKGNLTKGEAALLKQSLMNLRFAFVEAVEAPAEKGSEKAKEEAPAAQSAKPAQPAPAEEESHKKFSKKY